MHAELPIASFICASLVLIPLPSHWRAGTVPIVAISIWLFLSNFINGLNAIIWAGNVNVVVPVLCDITTKIIIGGNVALPAAIFCLCLQLERVASGRLGHMTLEQKRRRQIVDTFLCFGVPLIYMVTHYVVQGHRFDIFENLGCKANTYISLPSLFLVWVPPLLFDLGTCILSILAFRHFWIRRINFAKHLQNSNSALTPLRYFRLMSLSIIQLFMAIATTNFNMWLILRHGLQPWTSWAAVHHDFGQVGQFPSASLSRSDWLSKYILWWAIPFASIIFFAFFAFGHDAVQQYRACFSWIWVNIFRQHRGTSTKDESLPIYRSTATDTTGLSFSEKSFSGFPNSRSSDMTLVSPMSLSYDKSYSHTPMLPTVPDTPISPATSATPTYYASSPAAIHSRLHDEHSWTDATK